MCVTRFSSHLGLQYRCIINVCSHNTTRSHAVQCTATRLQLQHPQRQESMKRRQRSPQFVLPPRHFPCQTAPHRMLIPALPTATQRFSSKSVGTRSECCGRALQEACRRLGYVDILHLLLRMSIRLELISPPIHPLLRLC